MLDSRALDERGRRIALEVNKQHVKAASSESGLQMPKLTSFDETSSLELNVANEDM
jgi:hypothetical protein